MRSVKTKKNAGNRFARVVSVAIGSPRCARVELSGRPEPLRSAFHCGFNPSRGFGSGSGRYNAGLPDVARVFDPIIETRGTGLPINGNQGFRSDCWKSAG